MIQYANAQEIIFQKTYKLSWNSSFVNGLESETDSTIIVSYNYIDSTDISHFDYVNSGVLQLDKKYNIIWEKTSQKYSGNVLLFFDSNYNIVSICNYFKIRIGTDMGDFYPSLTRFDLNGNQLFKNIDTISNQTHIITYPGVYSRFNGDEFIIATPDYLHKDSVYKIIFKYFDKNADFILEDTIPEIPTLQREDRKFLYLSGIVYNKSNDNYSIISQVSKRYLSDSNYVCLLGHYKDFNNRLHGNSYLFLGPFYKQFIYDVIINDENKIVILTRLTNYKEKTTKNELIIVDNNSFPFKVEYIDFNQFSDVIMYNLDISPNGNIYCSGRMWDYQAQKYGFFVCKLNRDYSVDWYKIWQVDDVDKGIGELLINNEENKIIALGTNNFQSYLAVIGVPTSITNTSKNRVLLSPNPATDYIEINLNNRNLKDAVERVKVYDVLGNVVLSTGTSFLRKQESTGSFNEIPVQVGNDSQDIRLDVSGLATGIYFVRVGEQMLKFVKM